MALSRVATLKKLAEMCILRMETQVNVNAHELNNDVAIQIL